MLLFLLFTFVGRVPFPLGDSGVSGYSVQPVAVSRPAAFEPLSCAAPRRHHEPYDVTPARLPYQYGCELVPVVSELTARLSTSSESCPREHAVSAKPTPE